MKYREYFLPRIAQTTQTAGFFLIGLGLGWEVVSVKFKNASFTLSGVVIIKHVLIECF